LAEVLDQVKAIAEGDGRKRDADEFAAFELELWKPIADPA
jgi:hypothetical protein